MNQCKKGKAVRLAILKADLVRAKERGMWETVKKRMWGLFWHRLLSQRSEKRELGLGEAATFKKQNLGRESGESRKDTTSHTRVRTLKTKRLFGSQYLAPYLQANLRQQIASPNGTRQKMGIQHLPDPSIISVKMKGLPKSSPFSLSRLSLLVESDSAAPRTAARQAPLAVRFPREDHWSGLPCPPPGDLPDPGGARASRVSCPGRRVLYRRAPREAPSPTGPWTTVNRMTNRKASNQPGEHDPTSCWAQPPTRGENASFQGRDRHGPTRDE